MILFALLGCLKSADLVAALDLPTDSDVVATAAVGERLFLIGQVNAEPSGTWERVGDMPATWIAPTTSVAPEFPLGGQWSLGAGVCTVSGYAAVVMEYSEGEPTDAPSCGSPTIWAEVACDATADGDLAVPLGKSPVVTGIAGEQIAPGEVETILATLPTWADAQREVQSDATARAVESSTNISGTRYQIGVRPVLLVDAAVMSADGQNYCGGEDAYRRALFVVLDTPAHPVLAEVWLDDYSTLTDVVEIGDQIRVRVNDWGTDSMGDTTLGNVASCVCGC